MHPGKRSQGSMISTRMREKMKGSMAQYPSFFLIVVQTISVATNQIKQIPGFSILIREAVNMGIRPLNPLYNFQTQ
jgi:hypothetical protein